jgi:MinD-like ATPase involved in chromosome partitioning or flagellar assembly
MVNDRIYKIIMATGIPELDSSVSKLENCEVIDCITDKNDLYVDISNKKPQIVIVSDLLKGDDNLINMLTILKKEYPYTRFIYLAGQLNPRDQERIAELGRLVLNGIYDICISKEMSLELIDTLIKNPKSEDSVSYLAQKSLSNAETSEGFELPITGLAQAKNIGKSTLENVFVFTSIKPGTGKSFLSVNTACAIAKYGKVKEDGTKPSVILVEADLQTLSIGTILNIKEDKKKNMKTVMQAISTIFDKGNMVGEESDCFIVNKIIKDCLVTYQGLDNLDVLAGSTLTPEEVDSLKISPEYYIYLLEALKREYDVVIIDTNSSMLHLTTYPLLQKAEKCFYIINLDINNIRNNLRYLGVLKKLNLTDKIYWVLNENVENNKKFKDQGTNIEKLYFTADELEKEYHINLTARIPTISKTVFLNRIYSGTPVVLDKESIEYTADAREALLGLANEIWTIEKNNSTKVKEKKSFLSFLTKNKKKKNIKKEENHVK